MIAYLGGDADTLAVRRAIDNDVRVAIEFPTERRMLVLCVMQTGEIIMSWDDINPNHTESHRATSMHLVGQLVSHDGGISHLLVAEQEDLGDRPAVVHYLPSKPER